MGCAFSSENTVRENNLTIIKDTLGKGKNLRDAKVKIVLLGNSGVGKSSIALCLCHGRFSEHHQVTVGAAFFNHTIELKNGVSINLNIWDTGGQERFRSIAPLYYRDALGAIIVYDSNNAESFDSLRYWINEIKSKGARSCCIIVAANKKDLPKEIDSEIVSKFCAEEHVTLIECSAKTGENINLIFEKLAHFIYATFKEMLFENDI